MSSLFKNICVNCGSSPGLDAEYLQVAGNFGRILAGRQIGLIYGGSNVGLMGAVANATLASHGKVIGVITEELNAKVGHAKLHELHVVGSMHERKKKMFELADAYVVLPGGLGTLDEALELLTWAQLGIHAKPIGILNIRGYYDGLLRFLDHAVEQRFLKAEHRRLPIVSSDPVELLAGMEAYEPIPVEKWLDRKNE